MTARQRTPQHGDLVIVYWDDIADTATWADNVEPMPCETVGWVEDWTDKVARLVGTYGTQQGKDVRGYTIAIPVGCITEVTTLQKAVPNV